MSFESLGLLPELTRALADRGYTEPTPVQSRVIPEILAGRDLLLIRGNCFRIYGGEDRQYDWEQHCLPLCKR